MSGMFLYISMSKLLVASMYLLLMFCETMIMCLLVISLLTVGLSEFLSLFGLAVGVRFLVIITVIQCLLFRIGSIKDCCCFPFMISFESLLCVLFVM